MRRGRIRGSCVDGETYRELLAAWRPTARDSASFCTSRTEREGSDDDDDRGMVDIRFGLISGGRCLRHVLAVAEVESGVPLGSWRSVPPGWLPGCCWRGWFQRRSFAALVRFVTLRYIHIKGNI